MERRNPRPVEMMPDPPYVQVLFSSTRFAWLWTLIRLYVGWSWFQAGLGKVGSPAWAKAVATAWARAEAPSGSAPRKSRS